MSRRLDVSAGVKSSKVAAKVAEKAARSRGAASSGVTRRPSSRLRLVTPFPTIPQGTMWSNQLMSVLKQETFVKILYRFSRLVEI
jgi:hypothetical protein